MTDDRQDSTETITEYEHVEIVRERRPGEPDRFHVDDVLDRLKTFESKAKAELYADVYTVVGGFREEKAGERGVPPAVAAAREDVLMAYLTAQPTMSLQWAARFYDEDEAVVRQYVNAVQDRALAERAGTEGDTAPTDESPVEPPDPDLVDDEDTDP
jgi:hypothetical protein